MPDPRHAPYERLVPGASRAVVFIHGILSTPRFWDACLPAVPPQVSVVCVLLPGHGGSVPDFGRVKRGQWQAHADGIIDRLLETHDQVYLVGHSMGALLSILRAVRKPEGVAGLLTMAAPLRIRIRPSAFIRNILKGLGLADAHGELASAYGTEQDARIWRYLSWLPRYLELFSLSRSAREALPRLTLPVRAFQHGRDELVSPKSGRLLAACPPVRLTVLEASMHHEIVPEDQEIIRNALREMLAP